MSNKYLAGVSLAMIAVAVIGLVALYAIRGGLPAVPGYDWPERDEHGASRDEAAQRAEVVALRAKATATSRFLAGTEATRRIARPLPDKLDFRDKYDSRGFFEAARLHAMVAIILLWVVFGCGVLGLARLKVRGLVAVGGGFLVLAILGGGALLVFTGAGTLAGILLAIMLLGFFGQLIGANLMVGANHPFVVHAEEQMLALPPDRRRAYIAKRVIGGIALTLFGGAATAASIAIGGPVVVVATGAIAGGLMMMATPLIASIRMRVQRS